jgi:hypothetical protein
MRGLMKILLRVIAIVSISTLCGWSISLAQTPSSTNPDPQQPTTGQPGAQPQNSAGQANAKPTRIAPGSVIPVQLTKTIDAKKAKTGEQVEAKVTQDMKTANGAVLVPKDTKVLGHVTEAQPRGKEQEQSQLAIAFDHAVTKDGNNMEMPMSIQAVIAPPGTNNASATNGDSAGGGPSTSSPAASQRTPGMQGSGAPTPPQSATGSMPSDSQQQTAANPPITGETKGVVGIPHLTLSAGTNASDGSVLSSDKNNVKLESGTLLLLRVSQ